MNALSSAAPPSADTCAAAPAVSAAGSSRLVAAVPLGAGVVEEALSFAVGGEAVRGVLLRAEARAAVGLLFLHGWGGVRGGPHNLLTEMARALAGDGVPSLRFDFRGRGDSAGNGLAASLDGMADDALAAAACLRQRTGVKHLILVGLCSGGNVGLGVLDRLPEATGLFGLSVYPFGDGDSFGRQARRTAHYLREYWGKVWRADTWRRAWRGELHYGIIAKVLFGGFRRRRAAASAGGTPACATSSAKATAAATESAPVAGPSATAIPAVTVATAAAPAGSTPQQLGGAPKRQGTRHLHNLLARRLPVRLIYGNADPDFRASFAYFKSFADEHQCPVVFKVIPGASHNFYSRAWTTELIEELRAFVRANA